MREWHELICVVGCVYGMEADCEAKVGVRTRRACKEIASFKVLTKA